MKTTWPVGAPAVPVSAAVMVTSCPKDDGLGVAVTVMVKARSFTSRAKLVELLPLKLASPSYVAVMSCVPVASVAVGNVATPEPSSVAVPSVCAPSLKV